MHMWAQDSINALLDEVILLANSARAGGALDANSSASTAFGEDVASHTPSRPTYLAELSASLGKLRTEVESLGQRLKAHRVRKLE